MKRKGPRAAPHDARRGYRHDCDPGAMIGQAGQYAALSGRARRRFQDRQNSYADERFDGKTARGCGRSGIYLSAPGVVSSGHCNVGTVVEVSNRVKTSIGVRSPRTGAWTMVQFFLDPSEVGAAVHG